jgi:hypothetical protein
VTAREARDEIPAPVRQEIGLMWLGRQIRHRRRGTTEPTRLPAAFAYLRGMEEPFPPPSPEWGPLAPAEAQDVAERIAILQAETPDMDAEAAEVCALWLVLRARGSVEPFEWPEADAPDEPMSAKSAVGAPARPAQMELL